ncbi:DUF3144 domain-containing protein [Shewanella colwelliana]|uniref:DUF3144 domain-containing protein n=1 Tax=Shewanella colwelliana TaxID=23 RepID=UPI000490EE2E|nr:DUF3144 domain-containing protein [Shewanella colwelliana]
MSENKTETTIFQLADQFIALANELSGKEQDVGKVDTAMRFAAARFNAFEASLKSSDLAAEKANALEWFSNEYKEMLSDNLDDHIDNPPGANKEPVKDDSVQVFNG